MTRAQKIQSNPAITSQSSAESKAIYIALVSGTLGFLLSLLVFWQGEIPLFGRGQLSLGLVATTLGSIIALVVYLLAVNPYTTNKHETRVRHIKQVVSTWSLALTHGLLVFLFYALLFIIVALSFKGVTIDKWATATVVALTSGAAAYFVYLSAVTMNAVRVSMLLALFLLSGTFVSMLTANDPTWWDAHFSSLGAGGGVSGYTFNGTLIIAGMVIVALTNYIAEDFNKLQQVGRISQKTRSGVLQSVLAGIGIFLALVGLFVYDAYPAIHNTAAGGMAILFLGLIVGLPWITPRFSRAFFIASFSLFGALLVAAWLYMTVGYLNLTVFEFVAGGIIFTWLVIFVRHVAALLDDDTPATAAKSSKPKH